MRAQKQMPLILLLLFSLGCEKAKQQPTDQRVLNLEAEKKVLEESFRAFVSETKSNEASIERQLSLLQKRGEGLESRFADLTNVLNTNSMGLQQQVEALRKTVEMNNAREVSLQADMQNKIKHAIGAFAKIESATQIGINLHDYGALLIETKADYEALKASLPEAIQNHLDSAINDYTLANRSWKSLTEIGDVMDLDIQKIVSPRWDAAKKEIQEAKQLSDK